DLISDYRLLHDTQQNPSEAESHQLGCFAVVVRKFEFKRPLDRTCRQLRKKAGECNKAYRIGPCRVLPPLDINRISHQLEGVGRNPQGHNEVPSGESPAMFVKTGQKLDQEQIREKQDDYRDENYPPSGDGLHLPIQRSRSKKYPY